MTALSGESELQRRIQSTIDEWVAESGGGSITSWHLIWNVIDADGDKSWLYTMTALAQDLSVTMGLIAWAEGVSRFEQTCLLEDVAE